MAILLLGWLRMEAQQEHSDTLTLSTLGPYILREPLVPRTRAASSIPEPGGGKGIVGSCARDWTGPD